MLVKIGPEFYSNFVSHINAQKRRGGSADSVKLRKQNQVKKEQAEEIRVIQASPAQSLSDPYGIEFGIYSDFPVPYDVSDFLMDFECGKGLGLVRATSSSSNL